MPVQVRGENLTSDPHDHRQLRQPRGLPGRGLAREGAEQAFDRFDKIFGAKYPKAVECLKKDRTELLAFYDFPAPHWVHLRTTNPVESTFATVRLRTGKTRNCLSRSGMLAMVFKLCQAAERNWRRLQGYQLLADIVRDVRFVNGIREDRIAA